MRDVSAEQVRAWFENMKQADKIVVQCGILKEELSSVTSQTLLEIQNEHPDVTLIFQKEDNSKFQWDEAMVRNQCLSHFTTEWTIYTDADELITDKFWTVWKNSTQIPKDAYYLPHYNLWEDMNQVRVGEKWYPDESIRIFRNGRGFHWVGAQHASIWQGLRQMSPTDIDAGKLPEFHIFHYHRVNPNFREADKTHPTSLKDIEGEVIIRKLLENHPEAAKYYE